MTHSSVSDHSCQQSSPAGRAPPKKEREQWSKTNNMAGRQSISSRPLPSVGILLLITVSAKRGYLGCRAIHSLYFYCHRSPGDMLLRCKTPRFKKQPIIFTAGRKTRHQTLHLISLFQYFRSLHQQNIRNSSLEHPLMECMITLNKSA